MSQAIELIAGSTSLTLLITSTSQVPRKFINLDEIPETVQACLKKKKTFSNETEINVCKEKKPNNQQINPVTGDHQNTTSACRWTQK